MTKTRTVRKPYLCKLKKRPGILSEVFYIKHCLRIWKVWEVYSKACIDAISGSKVRYSTRHRHLKYIFAIWNKWNYILDYKELLRYKLWETTFLYAQCSETLRTKPVWVLCIYFSFLYFFPGFFWSNVTILKSQAEETAQKQNLTSGQKTL